MNTNFYLIHKILDKANLNISACVYMDTLLRAYTTKASHLTSPYWHLGVKGFLLTKCMHNHILSRVNNGEKILNLPAPH